jgi:flagellar basal-body rod protein FlgF
VIRGMYTAATGMVAEQNRQNVVANNLANVNTTGFKSDHATNTPFATLLLNAYNKNGQTPVGPLGLGVEVSPTYTDFSGGSLVVTENPFDLAIDGEALFTVEVNGDYRFTRSGRLQLDRDQYLTTAEGYRVLGERGPIQLNRTDLRITEEGEIIQDGQVIDRLRLAGVGGMVKEGDNLYRAAGQAQPATNYRILQGSLETSNVNSIQQMIEMINLTRSYDTNQKALTAHDETLGKAVNELAR